MRAEAPETCMNKLMHTLLVISWTLTLLTTAQAADKPIRLVISQPVVQSILWRANLLKSSQKQ